MKMFDLPPVWMALVALGVWLSRSIVTAGQDWWAGFGTGLIALGLGVMVWAAVTMTRARTTVVPHRTPSALVTSGLFAFSRNPIYLGDVLILVGLCLRWEAPLGLALVPVFIWWITQHFILEEERRMSGAFGDAFTAYAARVRRWI